MTLRGKTVIVGIGETPVGKLAGSTAGDLQAMAARLAMADAGLEPSDVGALFAKPMNEEPVFLHSMVLGEVLGLRPSFTAALDSGGTTCVSMLASACAGIASGLFDVALCVAGAPDATFRKRLPGVGMHRGGEEFERPFGIVGAIPEFAMVAQRHMAEYGTTSEQLAEIAVSTRYNASLNENAYKRTPITVADVCNSRLICEPLHLLDCSIPIDGAGAFIVTSSAKAADFPHPPVFVLGLGGKTTHRFVSETPAGERAAPFASGQQAYQMAGIRAADVDVAELYDCFTITTLVQLENLGFCEPGEGGDFVAGGRTRVGGRLPVNTHGGLLSQGHVDGMLHIVEGVRQIRGEAGARQVPECDIALVTGVGGSLSSHMTAILSRTT